MQSRRLRPVAALTLALVAAPFLAATAVASQAGKAGPHNAVVVPVTWPADTRASVTTVLARIELVTAADAAPPVRATEPPPPPPPPPATDPATWIWPGNGPITSGFGTRWGRLHQGVDIDAAYGSAVVAAQRGTVTFAGWGQSGYGRVVHVDHGFGLVTTYNHLSSIAVGAGQVVEQGQLLGAVGASGSVTAAHLHYEVHVNGVPTNPMAWLAGGLASSAGNPG